jgi:hypothetical protein
MKKFFKLFNFKSSKILNYQLINKLFKKTVLLYKKKSKKKNLID